MRFMFSVPRYITLLWEFLLRRRQDVKKIAYLMHTGAPQDELERAVVNGVNRRFFGKDIPADVVEVCT